MNLWLHNFWHICFVFRAAWIYFSRSNWVRQKFFTNLKSGHFGPSIWPWNNKSICLIHTSKCVLLSNILITKRPPIFNLFSQEQIGCSKFPHFGNFDLLIIWFDLQKHTNVFNTYIKKCAIVNIYDHNMVPSFNWWALSQIRGRKRSTSQALFLKSDFVHFLWFFNKIGYTKFINWLKIKRSSDYENCIPSNWIDV